jgi:small subunit ribosomal protein S20
MAITKGAKKANRASLKKRVYNVRRKAALHDTMKEFKTNLMKGMLKEAKTLIPAVYKAIDKAEKRGVIKKNTAARKKSRLMAQIKKIELK